MPEQLLPGTPGHVTSRHVTFQEDYHVPAGYADPPLSRVGAVCADIRHIAFTTMIVGACCCPLAILALLMLALVGAWHA